MNTDFDLVRSDLDTRSIPLTRISQGDNSRLTYDEEEMISLMVSMKQTGLLQAIGVTETEKGEFRVVFGNRRYIAAKKLGWKTIDATVFKTRDYVSEVLANIQENAHQADVALPELGRAFHMLTQEGLTLGEIAARVACPKHRVKVALDAFNRVPPRFRNKIAHGGKKPGMIGGNSMQRILNMKLSPEDTDKVFEAATHKEMSEKEMTQVAGYVRKGLSPDAALTAVDTLKNVMVHLTMKKVVVDRLLRKYNSTSINAVLMDMLRKIPELEL